MRPVNVVSKLGEALFHFLLQLRQIGIICHIMKLKGIICQMEHFFSIVKPPINVFLQRKNGITKMSKMSGLGGNEDMD